MTGPGALSTCEGYYKNIKDRYGDPCKEDPTSSECALWTARYTNPCCLAVNAIVYCS